MSKRAKMPTLVAVSVHLPMLPNFLRDSGPIDRVWDVAEISDATLRRIGKAWTDALVEHAQKRRRKP